MQSGNIGQGCYWLLTVPKNGWTPCLPTGVSHIRGQLERGGGTGYEHWQIMVTFQNRCRMRTVKQIFGNGIHAELSRSVAAREYVWKEDTRVPGTMFEYGVSKVRRNSKHDWGEIWDYAIEGKFDQIPAGIRVSSYHALRTIRADHEVPVQRDPECWVFWGATGTGKSHRAWEEAGVGAYPKDPRTKFWDGYKGEENVVIDEFRGAIDIGHLLRWLDKYPVRVEIKGSSAVFRGCRIWITSNLSPDDWYPGLDDATRAALRRRLRVTEFHAPLTVR